MMGQAKKKVKNKKRVEFHMYVHNMCAFWMHMMYMQAMFLRLGSIGKLIHF